MGHDIPYDVLYRQRPEEVSELEAWRRIDFNALLRALATKYWTPRDRVNVEYVAKYYDIAGASMHLQHRKRMGDVRDKARKAFKTTRDSSRKLLSEVIKTVQELKAFVSRGGELEVRHLGRLGALAVGMISSRYVQKLAATIVIRHLPPCRSLPSILPGGPGWCLLLSASLALLTLLPVPYGGGWWGWEGVVGGSSFVTRHDLNLQ